MDALGHFEVREVDELMEAPAALLGWFAFSNDSGVVAYFANESDALRFRLAETNRRLNG